MSREEFGDNIQPRTGFSYPVEGDEITVLKDFKTSILSRQNNWLRAGDVGTIVENRKPGTFDQVRGYMGLVVRFERAAKTYPAGFVIPWDQASDPETFAYRTPSKLVPKP